MGDPDFPIPIIPTIMIIENKTYTTSYGETFKTREEAEIAEATYGQCKQIEDFCNVHFSSKNPNRASPATAIVVRAITTWEALRKK